MFVWRKGNELWLTPQTDHQEFVGAVAAAWGGGRVLPPLVRRSAVLAARTHDEGWREWELCPEIDPGWAADGDGACRPVAGRPGPRRRANRERGAGRLLTRRPGPPAYPLATTR